MGVTGEELLCEIKPLLSDVRWPHLFGIDRLCSSGEIRVIDLRKRIICSELRLNYLRAGKCRGAAVVAHLRDLYSIT